MEQRIPNHFHFIFGLKKQKEPFHLVYYLCIESCLQVNHPDKIYFYYHYEPYGKYWEKIKEKISPIQIDLCPYVSRYKYKDRGVKKYSYAHHSDFIRIEKLCQQGGIYADIDTIFVNKIPEYLFSKQFVLGRENDIYCKNTKQFKTSLCNAFIMSQKKADFAMKWLQGMEKAFNGSWSNHSTILPQELTEKYPELIHIEPQISFYKHMWTRDGIGTLLQKCNPDYSGVISMHLWGHLWWSWRRLDFTRFHAGKLTEEYIQNVDTTYNLVARRFLPVINK
jgi:hypothetical protein